MTATRRLAAILAADVAGYSRLMGADEEGTLERLNRLQFEGGLLWRLCRDRPIYI
jgi:class 3 adenylate cyclase